MNGPPLSPSEISQILGRSVDDYLATGLDRSAALVETERPPTGLLVVAN